MSDFAASVRKWERVVSDLSDAGITVTVGQSATKEGDFRRPDEPSSHTAAPSRSAEPWQWPVREQREHERDLRDWDDREPDPLGAIYEVDEPAEWRA